MEKSASEPSGVVLQDSDYYLPAHGVGDTGHATSLQFGRFAKDTGQYSSRINQIVRQAEKYPGPGKYQGHVEWSGSWGIHSGNKFANGSREYKQMHKNPDPTIHERKDLTTNLSNASKDNLSTNPKTLYGKFPKGKKRSFLTQTEEHASKIPAPGKFHGPQVYANKTNPRVCKMTEWSKETVQTVSKGKKEDGIAPSHYSPSWSQVEQRSSNFTVPKEVANNFLDKAVKAKVVITKDKVKMPTPGPGSYDIQSVPFSKTSRGTFHLQLRGLSRSPASGYF
eukprot:TRINITY_DN44604_c0_g1_i1.p1 TRINITY_DN44604_c0_g1~~TRINITY_DN44604_c0_g1_i1.p1  ORF type:complete len:280 (+),score=33.10 TRINITY_DN44604_c0_g1_i1:83-922(+)